METPNVNNLNGVPNFGHGLEGITAADLSIDKAPEEIKTHKSKVKSAAQKALGGRYSN